MLRILVSVSLLFMSLFSCKGKDKNKVPTTMATSKNIYDYSFTSIEGKEVSLSSFKGKYLMLVNTASACGYTSQYKELEEVHKQYGNKLVIIGFPANDFGGQEPGSDEEIKSFCSKNYGVSFLMASKISIKSDTHPIYQWLTKKDLNGVQDNEVSWNFNKFLISPKGAFLGYFKSKIKPNDAEIITLLK